LRRIFGPKKDKATGEWRKLHNEELNELYCLLNIIRGIKSRRMRWAGDVARMEERCIEGLCGGKLNKRDNLKDPGIDLRIILRWIFMKRNVGVWTGSSWLGTGQVAGTCECGNEPSNSIKCWEFLE